MARRKSKRRISKMQPALLDLQFEIPAGQTTSFIDTQLALSMANRRLYDQGRMVAYQGLTFCWKGNGGAGLTTVEVKIRTAPNTWIVQNAFVKGKALWNQMQALVLEDNPSVAGKWHDFKLLLSDDQITANSLTVRDGDGAVLDFVNGEWNISTYVMPQHEVDPATGLPLPADELTPVLIGPDTATKRSLVKAYEESRSTVQSPMPNMPAGLAGSFFSLLTDTGSQEPELADVIEGENENPPYDRDNYPGGGTNAPTSFTVGYAAISAAEVDGRVGPFIAPCGLVQIDVAGFDAAGDPAAVPALEIILHVAPGMYKGTASVPMGQ